MRTVFLKKPNIVWAFLFFVSFSAHAGFYEKQIEPVKERAFDSQSQEILLAGFLSASLAHSQDSAARDQYGHNRTMAESTSKWGNEFGTYAVGPLIAAGQLVFDSENGQSHARALIYTGAVTEVLKIALQRERPNGSDHHSMPSGHTSTAFATATSLTYAYGLPAAAVAYPVAIFVGMSRMADDMHWFSDTVAGAFLGVWMGRACSYSTKDLKTQNEGVLLPVVSADVLGFQWRKSF